MSLRGFNSIFEDPPVFLSIFYIRLGLNSMQKAYRAGLAALPCIDAQQSQVFVQESTKRLAEQQSPAIWVTGFIVRNSGEICKCCMP